MIFGVEAAEVIKRVFVFLVCWIGMWAAIAFPLFRKFQWRPFQATPPEQKIILLIPLYLIAPLVVWGQIQSSSFLGHLSVLLAQEKVCFRLQSASESLLAGYFCS